MKLAYCTFSDLAADSILTAMWKTGFDSGIGHPYKIISGLPEDAKLVGINKLPDSLQFVFSSESFPEVANQEELDKQSPLTIVAQSYERNK